jgi:ATPase subunit of ABC transporter with duplicated ATPase domains
VSQLATRILEIRSDGLRDYPGTYEEYVHACGDDHLDVDRVVLKAKKEKRQKDAPARRPAVGNSKAELTKVREHLDTVTARMEAAESRIGAIDALFCQPDYYTRTPGDEVRALEEERTRCQSDVADSLAEWEKLEATIAKLDQGVGG